MSDRDCRTRGKYAIFGAKSLLQPGARTDARRSDIRIGRFASTAVLAVALAGSGCASYSLTEAECKADDWVAIGYADGAAGHGAERMEKHREACRRVNVTPDQAAYNRGREKGLLQYCTRSNGLKLGRGGKSYGGVCPERLESAFLKAYGRGREIHDVERSIAAASEEIAAAKRAIERARAWTPEDELAEKLSRIDRNIARKRAEIVRDIEDVQSRLWKLPKTRAGRGKAASLRAEIERLELADTRLDLKRLKRHAAAKKEHERSWDRLVDRNRMRLAGSLERKSSGEQRKAALETRLSVLLKAVAEGVY